MATRTVIVTVCDHCGAEEGVSPYEVKAGSRRVVKMDLCAEGAAPLESLLEVVGAKPQRRTAAKSAPANKAATTKKTASGRTKRSKVVTLEEIEALKGK